MPWPASHRACYHARSSTAATPKGDHYATTRTHRLDVPSLRSAAAAPPHASCASSCELRRILVECFDPVRRHAHRVVRYVHRWRARGRWSKARGMALRPSWSKLISSIASARS